METLMTALLDCPALLDHPALVDHPRPLSDAARLRRRGAMGGPVDLVVADLGLGPATPPASPVVRPRPARMAPPRVGPAELAGGSLTPVPLRLTRRARLLCSISVLAGALLLTGVAAANSDAVGPAGVASATVVVGPGETLWQVASEVAPGVDTAGMVRQLRELNGLGSAPLQPGQVLAIPGS